MIDRRQFLKLATLAGAGLAWGCEKASPPLQKLVLMQVDPRSGRTLSPQQEVAIPQERWKMLDPGPPGFLLANAQGLATVSWQNGSVHSIEGPTEGLWLRADLLVGGEKVSDVDYELSARNPVSQQTLWSQTLGYSQLLGVTDSAVMVADPKGVRCLNLADGKQQWINPDLLDVKCHFLTQKSLLLGIGNQGKVAWIDPATGQVQREVTTEAHNRVIVLASDGPSSLAFTRRVALFGYGPSAAKPIWRYPVSTEEHESSLLAHSDSVALVELANSTVAFDINTGKKLWSAALCTRAGAGQGVAVLVFPRLGANDKAEVSLEAHDLRSGQLLWKKSSSYPATAATVFDQSMVLLGNAFD